MAISLFRPKAKPQFATGSLDHVLPGTSIEVMPRTAEKIADFRQHLPAGTEVFVAHIDGTAPADMQATVKRLADEGFCPVPHLPARVIPDRATLAEWMRVYRASGVDRVLVLGGGLSEPKGEFRDSMQLLETGLLGDLDRIFVAGHPEGNRDIDPDGGETEIIKALKWKADWAAKNDARMEIVTQFCFEAKPVIDWAARLKAEGLDMPIRIGAAGPAKLQTMIKFAIMCGVGPSLRVLERRARDVSKLLLPYTPDQFLGEIAAYKAANPDFAVTAAHFFPLGGISQSTEWLANARGQAKTQTA